VRCADDEPVVEEFAGRRDRVAVSSSAAGPRLRGAAVHRGEGRAVRRSLQPPGGRVPVRGVARRGQRVRVHRDGRSEVERQGGRRGERQPLGARVAVGQILRELGGRVLRRSGDRSVRIDDAARQVSGCPHDAAARRLAVGADLDGAGQRRGITDLERGGERPRGWRGGRGRGGERSRGRRGACRWRAHSCAGEHHRPADEQGHRRPQPTTTRGANGPIGHIEHVTLLVALASMPGQVHPDRK